MLKAKVKIIENFAEVEILDKKKEFPWSSMCFYSKDNFGDKVLGGGWIHKVINKNLSTKLTV